MQKTAVVSDIFLLPSLYPVKKKAHYDPWISQLIRQFLLKLANCERRVKCVLFRKTT